MKFSLRSEKSKTSKVKDDDRRSVASTELEPNEATRAGVYLFALVMFALGFGVVFAATLPWLSVWTAVAAVAAGLVCARCRRNGSAWRCCASAVSTAWRGRGCTCSSRSPSTRPSISTIA